MRQGGTPNERAPLQMSDVSRGASWHSQGTQSPLCRLTSAPARVPRSIRLPSTSMHASSVSSCRPSARPAVPLGGCRGKWRYAWRKRDTSCQARKEGGSQHTAPW